MNDYFGINLNVYMQCFLLYMRLLGLRHFRPYVTRGMCFEAERRPRDYSDNRKIGMKVL